MLGKDLVDFIQSNKLEEVKVITDYDECLSFSVFLDKEHLKEIEYSWNFKEDDQIIFFEWDSDDDNVDPIERRYLTTEEALEMRGLR